MDFVKYLPIVSTLFSAVFAASVFNRYRKGKRAYSLLWGIGLTLYGLGTLAEAVLGFTPNMFVLRLWYLTGAMLTAAWLGQGTIQLLIRQGRVARSLTLGLTLVSLLAAALVFAAPLSGTGYDVALPASAQYKEILTRSGLVILLTVLLNIYGSIGLIGGAIWSAWLFWRKRVLPNRVLGNILIAAGALMPASAGSLLKAGLGDWLYASELLGVIVMYAGFLLAVQAQPMEETPPAPVVA